MVLQPDQERVRSMLKDTITLMCKNGLTFKNKFSIEAVIGVTVDEENVFLISMNEIIKSATPPADSEASSSAEENTTFGEQRNRRRKRKRRSDRGSVSNETASEENGQSDAEVHERIPTKMIKGETYDDSASDKSEDIVFIKQEMEHVADNDQPWTSSSQAAPNFPDFSNLNRSTSQDQNVSMSSQPQDQMFSLADMNLMPMGGSQDTSVNWTGGGQYSQQGASQASVAGQSPSTTDQDRPLFRCDICLKTSTNLRSFQRHKKTHLGIYECTCSYCGRGFQNSHNLKAHLFIHTGLPGFKCDKCSEAFKSKALLRNHSVKMHSQQESS